MTMISRREVQMTESQIFSEQIKFTFRSCKRMALGLVQIFGKNSIHFRRRNARDSMNLLAGPCFGEKKSNSRQQITLDVFFHISKGAFCLAYNSDRLVRKINASPSRCSNFRGRLRNPRDSSGVKRRISCSDQFE